MWEIFNKKIERNIRKNDVLMRVRISDVWWINDRSLAINGSWLKRVINPAKKIIWRLKKNILEMWYNPKKKMGYVDIEKNAKGREEKKTVVYRFRINSKNVTIFDRRGRGKKIFILPWMPIVWVDLKKSKIDS